MGPAAARVFEAKLCQGFLESMHLREEAQRLEVEAKRLAAQT
jgi:hypothetical protein